MNNYYVYIYWRLDINEPFYVGMGHNNRWKDLKKYNRNKHFMRIANKYPIICVIVIDNLTEEQAHGIEIWLINELVFEYGYSIDISNNRSNEKGCHLVNCTWGGEGVSGLVFSEESKKKMSELRKGKTLSEETKIKISKSHKGKKLSEETKIKISKSQKGKKLSEETKKKLSESKSGENHPFYGKRHTEETKNKQSEIKKGKHHTEETKRKISKSNTGKHNGENNGNAKSIICLNDKKIFKTVLEASMYYNISLHSISKVLMGKHNNCGKKIGRKLKFKYLTWKHNKKYRIKNN